MAGEGDGGAAVAPLAGARVRPEPRAAPSSGTSVVPFGGPVRARAQRRRLGCGGALEIRRLCSFPHGVERLPSVVTNTADGRRWWRSRYVPRTFLG